jgi:hypothetical protein
MYFFTEVFTLISVLPSKVGTSIFPPSIAYITKVNDQQKPNTKVPSKNRNSNVRAHQQMQIDARVPDSKIY